MEVLINRLLLLIFFFFLCKLKPVGVLGEAAMLEGVTPFSYSGEVCQNGSGGSALNALMNFTYGMRTQRGWNCLM